MRIIYHGTIHVVPNSTATEKEKRIPGGPKLPIYQGASLCGRSISGIDVDSKDAKALGFHIKYACLPCKRRQEAPHANRDNPTRQ